MHTRLLPLCLFFLGAISSLHAQIIFTDIEPDSVVFATSNEIIKSYYVDFDGDLNDELELRHFNPDSLNMAVELHGETAGSREVLVNNDDHAAFRLEGDTISENTDEWGNDIYGVLDSTWSGGGDKFIGYRFKLDSEWHYAWVQVAIPEDLSSFTIKAFAYNAAANEPILAGQTMPLGQALERAVRQAKPFPNPMNTSAVFQLDRTAQNAQFELVNMLGKTVPCSYQKVGQAIHLHRSSLESGIYVYRITADELAITGRMIIADH